MQVRRIRIDAEQAGQRIDNFLLRELKGVPKTRIYRLLRKGGRSVHGEGKGKAGGDRQRSHHVVYPRPVSGGWAVPATLSPSRAIAAV